MEVVREIRFRLILRESSSLSSDIKLKRRICMQNTIESLVFSNLLVDGVRIRF